MAEDKEKDKQLKVDEHLFNSRSVLISGGINDTMAKEVCAKLLALAEASDDPIKVFVTSPGGHVESGDMIFDTIRFIKPKVIMIGMGWVASAGALIYVSVPKAQRYCTPNTRFLLHQPSGGAGGQASDIEIQASEMIKMRDRLNKIFAAETGQKLARIEKDTDRDFWMTADEAKKYGLVGKIVVDSDEIKL